MNSTYIKKNWNNDDYNTLLDELLSIKDDKYRQFQANLVPNIDNIIGIRVPVLRNYGCDIAKGNWREFLSVCKDNYYEETMLQGFVLNNVKENIGELIKYMDKFIIKIDNWATCDTFCSGMKIIKKNKQAFYPYVLRLLSSKEEFTIRVGLVMLIAHYIDENYIDEIFNISNDIKSEAYYVKMANAWLVATCYSKYRDKTLLYLENSTLDDWTHNKSIQKILESKTTRKEDRSLLKSIHRVL